jgi:hypothetical protein
MGQTAHQIAQARLKYGYPMVGIHMAQHTAASDTDTMQLQTNYVECIEANIQFTDF